MLSYVCYVSATILFYGCASSYADITSFDRVTNRTVDLSTYVEANKTSHVFLNYLDVVSDTIIDIQVVNSTVVGGFFIIQLHSFKASCNLSNDNGDIVTGKDTGLVQVDVQPGVVYNYTLRCNPVYDSVKVILAVVVYEPEDPVPGGCNLTFRPEISPYHNVTYTDSMVQVDVQLPSVSTATCDKNPVQTDMYHLYMREQTHDEQEYFDTITKMLTADDIVANAYNISKPDGVQLGRRYYSAYLGLGTVYAAVASYNGRTSAYIPTVSYACDTDNWDSSCILPTSVIWKIIMALLLFIGIFSLFAGHVLFRVQSWITGFVVGFYFGYIVSGLIQNISVGESVTMGIAFGVVLTAIWTCGWGYCRLSVFTPLLTVFVMDYILYCILLYTPMGDAEFFRSNINYWGIFIGILVFSVIPLIAVRSTFHIIACCSQGATLITILTNYCAGSNLHYIFINNIRRLTMSGFNMAVLDPVFQLADILLIVAWITFFVIGVFVQIKISKNFDPFVDSVNEDYRSTNHILWAKPLRRARGGGSRQYLLSR